MEDFSNLSHFRWTFGIILFVYLFVLYWLSLLASRKVRSVEDFVLAGRSLPLGISTLTFIATWFGAESLTTVANEVCDHGVSRAILDPLGVGLCLLLAGSFVAGPLWRSNVMTLGDLFRARYGPFVESLASWILVPSYLGWIAAQLLALATVLQTVFGIPSGAGIVVCAVVGSGYCMMGGMWSVSWTDAAQMGFIVLGLLAMAIASILATGSGADSSTLASWMGQLPSTHWSILSSEEDPHRFSTAMAALLIGSLGNLPTQDLLQRILSSRSERIAKYSCWLAGLGYLLLGSLPVLIGLAAAIYEPSLRGDDRDVLMHMATHLLSPVAMMLLLLAIVSTVLSTYSSAVLSPSSVLARNILEPLWERLQGRKKGMGPRTRSVDSEVWRCSDGALR